MAGLSDILESGGTPKPSDSRCAQPTARSASHAPLHSQAAVPHTCVHCVASSLFRQVLGLKRTVSRARGIADSMEATPAFETPSRQAGLGRAGGLRSRWPASMLVMLAAPNFSFLTLTEKSTAAQQRMTAKAQPACNLTAWPPAPFTNAGGPACRAGSSRTASGCACRSAPRRCAGDLAAGRSAAASTCMPAKRACC